MEIEHPKCDAGCGDDATIRLAEVGLCEDCFGAQFSEHAEEFLGWKPCGRPLFDADGKLSAACIKEHGTEHAHD